MVTTKLWARLYLEIKIQIMSYTIIRIEWCGLSDSGRRAKMVSDSIFATAKISFMIKILREDEYNYSSVYCCIQFDLQAKRLKLNFVFEFWPGSGVKK